MRTITPLFGLCLFIISCSNNDKEAAAILQHQKDSLQSVIKLQAQQRQIDSLKAAVANVAQATSNIVDANNDAVREAQENRRKSLLNMWTYQLRHWNTQLDVDNANLTWASQYHPMRLENTKQREMQQASTKIEQDKINIQKCQDSISKYQN